VPERDSRALYEKLVLDGFQAGLAWITILRKREGFRAAFAGFDPRTIAEWGPIEVERLLADPGIVRHRGKIEAAIDGARSWIRIEDETGFAEFVWSFVDDVPLQPNRRAMADVPSETEVSRAMSKALRAEGFRFVGPTIVYAFMQAAGLVNDHLVSCPRHAGLARPADIRGEHGGSPMH
jgi:DNA-3-methyladenine glycosylase I